MKRISTAILMGLWALVLLADTDRGVDLYRQGKYAEAQSELSKVVQGNPDDARAQRFLGLALVELHKPGDAQPYLAKANDLEPGGDSKLALARLYIEQKDLDKAESAMEGAEGEELNYVRGLLQFNRQRFNEAISSFESYLKDHPNHPYAHYYAGLAYNGAKRPDKMLSQFDMFLKLKPDAPEARKVRAVLSTGR